MSQISFRHTLPAIALLCLSLLPASSAKAQTVVATIPAQQGYLGSSLTIATDPFAQRVYIAGNGIEVVDQQTNQVLTNIPVGDNELAGVAINLASRKLYTVDGQSGLYVLDLATDQVIENIPLAGAIAVAFNPVTNRIYTLDQTGLEVFDGNTYAQIAQIPINGQSYDENIAIDPIRNRIYIPLDNLYFGSLVVVDGSTNQLLTTVKLGGYLSSGVDVDPFRNLIYVAGQLGSLDVVDGATDNDIATITVPGEATAVSVDPRNQRAYVSNFQSNEVEVVNTASKKLMKPIVVGPAPDFSTLDLLHGLLYVGNTGDYTGEPSSVSVVKIH